MWHKGHQYIVMFIIRLTVADLEVHMQLFLNVTFCIA
jgi:hypothetical protein